MKRREGRREGDEGEGRVSTVEWLRRGRRERGEG